MRNTSQSSAAAVKPSHATEFGAATSSHACLPDTGLVRQHQVLLLVLVSKSTLWRRVRSKSFPAPVKRSAHVTLGERKTSGAGFMSRVARTAAAQRDVLA
jgi:prophage regulatory protein